MSTILKRLAAIQDSPHKTVTPSFNRTYLSNNPGTNIFLIGIPCSLIILGIFAYMLHKGFNKGQTPDQFSSKSLPPISSTQAAFDHLSQKNYKAAITQLEAISKENPNDPIALSNLGFAHSAAGNLNEARSIYQTAIHKSENPIILQNLAILEMKSGRPGVSVFLLTNLESKNLCKGNCILHFALALELHTNISSAIEKYRLFLKESPQDEPTTQKIQERIKKLRSILASRQKNSEGS